MILLKFVYRHLINIHVGSIFTKTKSTFLLSLAASPIALLFEKIMQWFSLNYEYVGFVIIAILIDHLLGTWVHAYLKRDFSMRKNIIGLFSKCSLVVFVGILVEGFQYILGLDNFITDYFSVISRLMVFIYPAGSALMNCALITKGKFPPVSWLEKISRFNNKMDLEAFKKKHD